MAIILAGCTSAPVAPVATELQLADEVQPFYLEGVGAFALVLYAEQPDVNLSFVLQPTTSTSPYGAFVAIIDANDSWHRITLADGVGDGVAVRTSSSDVSLPPSDQSSEPASGAASISFVTLRDDWVDVPLLVVGAAGSETEPGRWQLWINETVRVSDVQMGDARRIPSDVEGLSTTAMAGGGGVWLVQQMTHRWATSNATIGSYVPFFDDAAAPIQYEHVRLQGGNLSWESQQVRAPQSSVNPVLEMPVDGFLLRAAAADWSLTVETRAVVGTAMDALIVADVALPAGFDNVLLE